MRSQLAVRLKWSKKVMAVMLCLGMVVLGACGSDSEKSGSDGPIRLGAVLPLSGAIATIGEQNRVGMEYAVDQINAEGGILGREVTITFGDDEADPTKAVTQARRIVQEADAMLGPPLSQTALAAIPVYTQAQVPSIVSAGSSEVTKEIGPYNFSNIISGPAQALAMIDYAEENWDFDTAGILTDSGAQGKEVAAEFKTELAKRGIKAEGQEFQYGATDMTPQILSMQEAGAQALFLFTTTGADTGNALKSMNEAGWSVPVLGSYATTFVADVAKIAGADTLTKYQALTYTAFTYCEVDEIAPNIKDFLTSLSDNYSDEMVRWKTDYVGLAADAVFLLRDAMEATESTDAEKVAAWIEENIDDWSGGLHTGYGMTDERRQILRPDSLSVIDPSRHTDDGLFERVDCP